MRRYNSTIEAGYFSLLETLYILHFAEKLKEAGKSQLTYREGTEMSSRDTIRYALMRLHDLDSLPAGEGARDRLTVARIGKYAKQSRKVDNIGRKRIYRFVLTNKGRRYLKEHYPNLVDRYSDKLKTILQFPDDLKVKLMPRFIILGDYKTDRKERKHDASTIA